MSYSVKHVANCFLQRDFEDGCATITPMKLQKLVYCLHGWHLAIEDEPAIDGQFEAWPYGPVEEELYHIFKSYGGNPIKSYATSWINDEKKAFVVPNSNHRFYEIVDFVAKKYMKFSATELSAMTHEPGTPWSITRGRRKSEIDNDLIKEHFRSIANAGQPTLEENYA